MNFLTPELFKKACKKVSVKSIAINNQDFPEHLQSKLLHLIQGEILLQDDVLLKACSMGLPIGFTVRLESSVDFYGDWDFSVDLKLVGCVVDMNSGLGLNYHFEISYLWLPEYFEDKYWDENKGAYTIPKLNELYELTAIEMIIELFSIKYT